MVPVIAHNLTGDEIIPEGVAVGNHQPESRTPNPGLEGSGTLRAVHSLGHVGHEPAIR